MARTTVHSLNSSIENRLVGGGIDGRNCENLGENLAQLIDKLAGKESDLELNTGGRRIQSQTEQVYCVKYSPRFRKVVLTQLRSCMHV